MIWPQSWTALLSSSCPNLEKVDVDASGDERKASRCRCEARKAFGQTLRSLPSSITDVSLKYLTHPPSDHFFEPPDPMDPQLGYDVFSSELGLLSQRLVKLVLVDATINIVEFFNSGETEWPSLEVLDFRDLQISCADGTWYCNMNPRAEKYEEDPQPNTLDNMRLRMHEDESPAPMNVVCNPFRLVMDETKFRDIYVAAAKAAQRMPELRRLDLGFDVQGDAGAGRGDHQFYYFHGSRRDKESWWKGGEGVGVKVGWGIWPPVDLRGCEEVFEAWREVGEAKGATIKLHVRNTEFYYDYRPV